MRAWIPRVRRSAASLIIATTIIATTAACLPSEAPDDATSESSSDGASQTIASHADALQVLLEATFAQQSVPGISAYVRRDGEVWHETLGLGDIAAQEAMDCGVDQ